MGSGYPLNAHSSRVLFLRYRLQQSVPNFTLPDYQSTDTDTAAAGGATATSHTQMERRVVYMWRGAYVHRAYMWPGCELRQITTSTSLIRIILLMYVRTEDKKLKIEYLDP